MNIKNILKNILSLEKLAIPVLLGWIYKVGFVLVLIGCVIDVFRTILFGVGIIKNLYLSDYFIPPFGGVADALTDTRLGMIPAGLFLLVVATPLVLLAWRLLVEYAYVLFGVYKQLQELNSKTKDSTKE